MNETNVESTSATEINTALTTIVAVEIREEPGQGTLVTESSD